MTFPTIPTVAAGRVLFTNQADTSGTRTFPSLTSLTKNSGDLLIAIITTYQSTTNPQFSGWGGGFTEFGDAGTSTTMGMGCAYKWSTGSETGTFTVTQAATITGHASMCLLSIPLAHPSTIPECGTIANGTSAAADPGSFNPAGWGTEDTLWIAVDANGMVSATGSWTACGAGTLTNYSDLANSNTTDSSTVGQTEIAVSFRQVAAASEDRGAISTHDTSNARNSALIIAIRSNLSQTLTQSSRFDNTNTFYGPTVTRGAVTVTQSARFDNTNTFYGPTISGNERTIGRITRLSLDGYGLKRAGSFAGKSASGSQSVTQSTRFDNSNAFYAAVVTRGTVTLAQSARFDNSNTFYAHTVSRGTVALTQSARYDNSNTFYAHVVTRGTVTLAQSTRFDNSNAFYSPTVTRGAVTLTQSARFDNTNTFYSATITKDGSLAQNARFDNANTFYAATVTRGSVALTQSARFDNSNTFYSPVVARGTVTITQSSRFDNSNAFYAASVTRGAVTLTQSARFDNSNTFYGPTVSQSGMLVQSERFDNTNTFYSHSITGGQTETGSGVGGGRRQKVIRLSDIENRESTADFIKSHLAKHSKNILDEPKEITYKVGKASTDNYDIAGLDDLAMREIGLDIDDGFINDYNRSILMLLLMAADYE